MRDRPLNKCKNCAKKDVKTQTAINISTFESLEIEINK
jgi:hypothetical protein